MEDEDIPNVIKTPKCSIIREPETSEQIARTTDCIDREARWVQQTRAVQTLDDIERSLFECLCRLNGVKKIPKSLKLPIIAPELKTINLVSLINPDMFSAKVTLYAENLQFAEISFKHLRVDGGVYRAQLKSQHKLKQLQDCTNKIVKTMKALSGGREKFVKAAANGYNQDTGKFLSLVLTEVRDLIKSCIKSLSAPEVRNYWELQFQAIGSNDFDPTPPPDLLVSFYISSDRLVCTIYQITQKQGNSHCLTSYHVESRVDTLATLQELLERARWSATSLLINLDTFQAYQSKSNE